MRTIEEITKDLSENNGMLLIQSVLTKEDKIRCLLKKIDLGNELIQAQDERIKKLEAELAECKKDWQAVCAVLKGRNKCKKYAGLWKEADHAND